MKSISKIITVLVLSLILVGCSNETDENYKEMTEHLEQYNEIQIDNDLLMLVYYPHENTEEYMGYFFNFSDDIDMSFIMANDNFYAKLNDTTLYLQYNDDEACIYDYEIKGAYCDNDDYTDAIIDLVPVVENMRDKYLESMGYDVFDLTTWAKWYLNSVK